MATATGTRARLPKGLRDLQRRLKPGWQLVKARSGHWHIQNDDGNYLLIEGKRWMTSGSWGESGFDKKTLYGQLRSADVLLTQKRTEYAPPSQAQDKRRARLAETNEIRRIGRDATAKALLERMTAAMQPVGELDREGMPADLCHIAAMLSRETDHPFTPDLLHGSLSRVIHGAYVTPPYQQVWVGLCEQMENSSNRIETFFTLVRRARGLPETVVVEPGKLEIPQGEEGRWAFEVLEIPITSFMVDHTYQRPTPWPFVRKTAASFDESLVGTIDVAERGHGAVFAILDGQCRFEACRLVGKASIWSSVYRGLSIEQEAKFFLHKNQDRKAIHPYYLYKARLASGDPETSAVEALVKEHGYRVWMATTGAEHDGSIASIETLHVLYKTPRAGGEENSLSPVLRVLEATRGRPHGQAGSLLYGLGVFFQTYKDVNEERVKEVLALQGADWLIGRGKEIKLQSSVPLKVAVARGIAMEYNRRLPAGERKLQVWVA